MTSAAVELIPGADTAGILLIAKGGKFESLEGPRLADLRVGRVAGAVSGSGPCIEAAADHLIVRVRRTQFRTAIRLARLFEAVARNSACAAVCRSSCTPPTAPPARSTSSALQPKPWDGEAESIGTVLAAHAAAAMVASRAGLSSTRAVDARPHRSGQGHHHGALQRRRRACVRHDAAAVPGEQHPAHRYRAAGRVSTRGD